MTEKSAFIITENKPQHGRVKFEYASVREKVIQYANSALFGTKWKKWHQKTEH